MNPNSMKNRKEEIKSRLLNSTQIKLLHFDIVTAFYFIPCIGVFLHVASLRSTFSHFIMWESGSVRRRHHFSPVISRLYGVGAGLEEKVG